MVISRWFQREREGGREAAIAQLYPKQHKMETQCKADSLLITLWPDGHLHVNCAPSIGVVQPLRV